MSHVQEDLFGSRRKKKDRGGRQALAAVNGAVISRSDLAVRSPPRRTNAPTPTHPRVPPTQKQNIKKRMIIPKREDIEAAKADLAATRQEKAKAAKDRKERMLRMAAEAKKKSQKSDLEVISDARNEAIKEMAENKLDENHDLVKLLSTLSARAAAFTIRDRQVEERNYQAAHAGDYDKRMDMLMEIDRLQDLKRRQEDEEYRRVKRVEDRSVIIEQIKARERSRMLEREAREQENQAMISLIKKYEDEDQAAAKTREAEVIVARAEVVAANDAAIARKQAAKQREKDEEEAVLIYQAKKDEEMRNREAEEAEKDRLAKETQARLLASQEKIMSKQGEIDELRARRHAEQAERRARARELGDAQKRQNQMRDLQASRKGQAMQRKSMMAREAVMQQQEYEDAVTHSVGVMERQSHENTKKHEVARKHREALQQQIETAQSSRKSASMGKYEEGRKLKLEFATERAKLEVIRSKMVEDMRRKGINERCVEGTLLLLLLRAGVLCRCYYRPPALLLLLRTLLLLPLHYTAPPLPY